MNIQIDVGKLRAQSTWPLKAAYPGPATILSIHDQLRAMAAIAGANAFAVLRVGALGARTSASLSVTLKSATDGDEEVSGIAAGFGPTLLAHMEGSLVPLLWRATPQQRHQPTDLDRLTTPIAGSVVKASGIRFDGIVFPVKLGSLGNGAVLFYGQDMDLRGEHILELHRKSYRVMKSLLLLDLKKSAPRQHLNDRELECLQFAGEGLKSELIAEKLDLSVHTVNAYLGSATAKLDSVNRIQAIAKAIRLGYLA